MTSEPDSTPRRRPPTIDLKATEVESEKSPSSGEAGATNPADNGAEDEGASGRRARWDFADTAASLRRRATARHAIGAVAGAVAMLAILAALWAAGLLPPRTEVAPPSSPASETAAAKEVSAVKEISARLDKIEAALAAQRPDAALAGRIAAAEAETKSLGDSLSALNRRIDGIAATAGSALAHADAAAAAVEAAKSTAQQSGVQRGDLDALASRVAALEAAVKALSDNVASVSRRQASADDRAARTTVAAGALRAAVERGVSYQAELAAVKALGIEENLLAPLEPFAADGIPSVAMLGRELAALTPALLRASGAAPSEHSFLGRLQANAQKLVRISPVDAPPGDDPEAVIARIDADGRRGDIAAALAEIPRLPDAARMLAAGWVKKAEAREAAVTASRRIAADALAALARPAAQ